MSPKHPTTPYALPTLSDDERVQRGHAFYEQMSGRRSVRSFKPDGVPAALIEHAILTASTAPSGAHRQPWTFVAISDPALKRQIRVAAEAEEKRNYDSRMPPAWQTALAPLGTTWEKPYLEVVPWIVVLFEVTHSHTPDGEPLKNYYVRESVGLAGGMFITALHQMGLATLTHTPSPMHFLTRLLNRPKWERPFILFPVGHPTDDCTVPDLTRKPLDEVAVFHTEKIEP